MTTDRKTQIKKDLEKEKIENKKNIEYIENKLKEFKSNDKRKSIKNLTSLSTNALTLTSVITGLLPSLIAPLYILIPGVATSLVDKIYKKAKNINIKDYKIDKEIIEKIDLVLNLQNLKEKDEILNKSLELVENYNTTINDKDINLNINKEKLEKTSRRINNLSNKMTIQKEMDNKNKNLKTKIDTSKMSQIVFGTIYLTTPIFYTSTFVPVPYFKALGIFIALGINISFTYAEAFTFLDIKKYIKDKTLYILKEKGNLDNSSNTENDKKELEYLKEKCSIEKIGYLNKKIYLKEKQKEKEKREEYINNYYIKKERIKNSSKQKVYVKTR